MLPSCTPSAVAMAASAAAFVSAGAALTSGFAMLFLAGMLCTDPATTVCCAFLDTAEARRVTATMETAAAAAQAAPAPAALASLATNVAEHSAPLSCGASWRWGVLALELSAEPESSLTKYCTTGDGFWGNRTAEGTLEITFLGEVAVRGITLVEEDILLGLAGGADVERGAAVTEEGGATKERADGIDAAAAAAPAPLLMEARALLERPLAGAAGVLAPAAAAAAAGAVGATGVGMRRTAMMPRQRHGNACRSRGAPLSLRCVRQCGCGGAAGRPAMRRKP